MTVNIQKKLTQKALGTSYSQYVAQTLLADPIGSFGAIRDAERSPELDVELLLDPVRIRASKELLASQLNDQSRGPTFTDLSERIADVQIQTVAQGASTLTLTVIDPTWALLDLPDANGNTFIQKDEIGRVLPIIISWPPETDCQWQICTAAPTWSADFSQANVTLTFEDRIVSDLRMVNAKDGGVAQGTIGQTLAGFMQSLVDGANRYYHKHPEVAGHQYPIKFVQMVSPQDPNYTPPPTTSGGTTKVLHRQPHKAKARTGMTAQQQAYVQSWRYAVEPGSHINSLLAAEQAVARRAGG